MSLFPVAKAESFFGTLLPLFQSQFEEFDSINIHSIWVFGCSQGGERLEGLCGPSTVLDDLFCMVPLVLEMSGLGIPLVDFVGDSVERYDFLYE